MSYTTNPGDDGGWPAEADMRIEFFDDPLEAPKSKEDVRIRKMGLYVFEDRRRVAVGFEITPFLERPSIEVDVTNGNGQPAGAMTIVDTSETNFTLTLHLRDSEPTDEYKLEAKLYYATPESDRADVHAMSTTFNVTRPGEQ
jgi:hypothetical protein